MKGGKLSPRSPAGLFKIAAAFLLGFASHALISQSGFLNDSVQSNQSKATTAGALEQITISASNPAARARAARKPPFRDESGVQHLPAKSEWSQQGQDLWAAQQFQQGGFYLDIGAHHANYMSNTRMLDDLGWRGMCIEPLIFKNRDWHKRSCEIVSSALVPVMPSGGTVTFTNCEDGSGVSGHSGVSGLIDRSTSERRKCSQVTVPAVTMESLLKKLPSIVQFVSLDIEGAELEILQSIPWGSLCVESMAVENKHGPKAEAVRQEITQRIPHKCMRVEGKALKEEDFFICDCRGFKPS
eukprot:TRINITY_DN9260_c0_g1_i6.p1 TRINITY_DN9260_c0_g1~~TRINITY_DN9260_c0_g1_i6.p1  ORF type:complete len:299 (+),score=49.11 TRINITY_DN9260_c0_g1_i6:75-971(+)